MSTEDIYENLSTWYAIYPYVYVLDSASVVLGALIIFGFYCRLGKPTFVCIMWGFFLVSTIANVAVTMFSRARSKAGDADQVEKSDRFSFYRSEAINVFNVSFVSGHWVFAIKYAKVVLMLPLLIFQEQFGDVRAKIKKISCIVWTLNSFFGALLITYSLFL